MMPPSRALHASLGRSDTEVLVVAADLLGSRVENDEVVHELEEPLLRAELAQLVKEGAVIGDGV